jgi:hypothetical protein
MYKIIFVLSFFLWTQTALQAQIVNIPDANFKALLLAHGTTITGAGISIIDTNGDGEVQVAEAQAYTGTIDIITGVFILDITGLESFIALTVLDISQNPQVNLDISANVALTSLSIDNYSMGSFDVSNNVNLVTLRCRNIGVTSLDLSQNIALVHLYCPYNQWTSLDLSNNVALTYLDCSENPITSLDLSNNIALTTLVYQSGPITSLDVSNNTALTYLNCSGNPITSLDLSNNIALTTLICQSVPMTSLDISNNIALTTLICQSVPMTSLDISNNIVLKYLIIWGTSLGTISNLDVSNNTALTYLMCVTGQLNALDLSNNTNLDSLVLWADLSNLDLSDNINLKFLSIAAAPLTHLDLSNNLNLDVLNIVKTQITRLDLSKHGGLSSFYSRETLPFLQICVPSVVNALSNPNWIKDPTGSYVEGCQSALTIEGSVSIDDNNNCQVDSLEVGFENGLLLLFENGIDSTYTLTNNLGAYQAYLDTGMHNITVLPTHAYWEACPNSQQVTVDTNYQVQTVDFSLQATTICPYLEVEIATPLLRRCFNSSYYVDYCNTGTAVANNVYVEVELDTSLYFSSSSIPLFSQNGAVYVFYVGNLPRDSCGRFSIDVTVSCSSQMGQIHCASAHIYPDFLCLTSLPNIYIADTCLTDTVLFVVTNYADAITLPYLILEDTVVVDTGSFMLNMGQSASIYYPISTSGTSTYQLVIANGNPMYYTASKLVGCDANSASTDLLYLPNLPQDFEDIDCTSNRGSYDPNDKTGYPLGYGNNHYIEPNSTIDYRIRFQNTGTDTAIFINILDTISSHLDIGTLNMGVASHPYTLHIMPNTPSGAQVLRFQFSPIYLPDSNVNEPASNGFIEYSIAQVANLPNGTVINNSASIYFDYNAPVQTNTTLHTVCDNCLPQNITNLGSSTININKIDLASYGVSVVPNPFKEQTRIVLEGYTGLNTDLRLEIYDVMGRLQASLKAESQAQFVVQRGEMPVGIYFFRISENGRLLQSGRLVVGE